MSEFLDRMSLDAADDSDGEKWLYRADLRYQSDYLAALNLPAFPGGLVTIKAGFVTDFASVPRLPVVFWLVGGRARYASGVHDWLYTKSGLSRKDADAVFLEAAKLKNNAGPLMWLMWAGVRLGGASHYEKA